MPRPNDEIAALLGEYAELISMTGGDAFRARSYERAARAIKGHPADVSGLGPAGLIEIPALGPNRALQLDAELGIGSVDELAEAVRAGRLRDLKGFGPKSEERI